MVAYLESSLGVQSVNFFTPSLLEDQLGRVSDQQRNFKKVGSYESVTLFKIYVSVISMFTVSSRYKSPHLTRIFFDPVYKMNRFPTNSLKPFEVHEKIALGVSNFHCLKSLQTLLYLCCPLEARASSGKMFVGL